MAPDEVFFQANCLESLVIFQLFQYRISGISVEYRGQNNVKLECRGQIQEQRISGSRTTLNYRGYMGNLNPDTSTL